MKNNLEIMDSNGKLVEIQEAKDTSIAEDNLIINKKDYELTEYYFDYEKYAVPSIVREITENATTQKAQNIIVCACDFLGERYLCIASDANKFEDENDLISSMKLNNGKTGVQGCGIPTSGLLAALADERSLNHRNFRIITFSKNMACVSEIIPRKNTYIESFSNIIKIDNSLLVPIKKLIGEFKFPNKKEISVLHLFKFNNLNSGSGRAIHLDACAVANIREFIPNNILNQKYCYRGIADSDNSIERLFIRKNSDDHIHNRITSGVSAEQYAGMYSWGKNYKKTIVADGETRINGKKCKIHIEAEVEIVPFPGLMDVADHQISLRDTDFIDSKKRSGGSGAGHDICDSTSRIIICCEKDNKDSSMRPRNDPIYIVNTKQAENWSGFYLDLKLTGARVYDSLDFLKNSLDLNILCEEDIQKIEEKVHKVTQAGKEPYRIPYAKILLKIKDSSYYGEEDDKKSLILACNLNSLFLAKNKDAPENIIRSLFDEVSKDEEFKDYKKKYLVPFYNRQIDDSLMTIPIEKKEKKSTVRAYCRVDKSNGNVKVNSKLKKGK